MLDARVQLHRIGRSSRRERFARKFYEGKRVEALRRFRQSALETLKRGPFHGKGERGRLSFPEHRERRVDEHGPEKS
jgi:hypothetical protein